MRETNKMNNLKLRMRLKVFIISGEIISLNQSPNVIN